MFCILFGLRKPLSQNPLFPVEENPVFSGLIASALEGHLCTVHPNYSFFLKLQTMKPFKCSFILFFFFATIHLASAAKLETSIRDFWAAVDKGDFDKAVGYLHPDVKVYLPLSAEPMGLEAYRGLGIAFRTGFPDILHKVLECSEGKMTVGVKGVFSGTNTGTLMGNPPTGNRVEVPFIQYWTFDAQGKAIRIDMAFDVAAFNMQLMKGVPSANHQFATTIFAELNNRDLDAVISNYTADVRLHGWAPQTIDANGYREAMSAILAAFPDAKFSVLDIIAEGDRVVVRHQLEGTHTGAAFQGIAKTGRKIMVPATVTIQIENGKAKELWLNADFLGLLMQLGANPMAGKN